MRLRVHDTGVSLVNCHLSSGQNEGDSQKRHCDYGDILRRGVYPHDGQSADLDVSLAGSTSGQVHFRHIILTLPFKTSSMRKSLAWSACGG